MKMGRVVSTTLVFAVCVVGSGVNTRAQAGANDQKTSIPTDGSVVARSAIGEWEGKTDTYVVRLEIAQQALNIGLWNHADEVIIHYRGRPYTVGEQGQIQLTPDDSSLGRVVGTITPKNGGTMDLDIKDMQAPDPTMRLVASSFKCILARRKKESDATPVEDADREKSTLPKGNYTIGEMFTARNQTTSERLPVSFRFLYYGGDSQTPAYIMMVRPSSQADLKSAIESDMPVLTAIVNGKPQPLIKGKEMDGDAFAEGLCIPKGMKWKKTHNGFVIE